MARLANNADIASDLIERLGDLLDACGMIEEAKACEGCPIKYNCIDDTAVGVFENLNTWHNIKEFLDYADEVERRS